MENQEDNKSSFEIWYLSNSYIINLDEIHHEINSSDKNCLNLGEFISQNNKEQKQEQFMENEDSKSYKISKVTLFLPIEKKYESNNENINTNKKNKFIILNKKRGRKPEVSKKNLIYEKRHLKDAPDNILKKIKVHFITFLINFANDAHKSILKEKKCDVIFKQILHKGKCNIKLKDVFKLEYKNIFTRYNISLNKGIKKESKNYFDKEITNEKNYEKICEISPLLKNLFNQKIGDIFKIYYIKNKNDINNIFDFNGSKIELSQNTKTFYDLLEKEENKNSISKFINVINKYFKCNLKINYSQ